MELKSGNITPEQAAEMLQELELQEKELVRSAERLKDEDPYWFYEPSTGELSEGALALLHKHIKPEDVPPKFFGAKDVISSKASIKEMAGGNRAQKTVTSVIDFLIQITGEVPPSIKDVYPIEKLPTAKINYLRHYGETSKMVEEVLVPAYRYWMPKKYWHKQGWERTYNKQEKVLRFYRDGEIFIGHISFWTYDQKVEDTQGATLKAINYDEVPPLAHFQEGIWRMTTGRVWMAIYATPTEGPNWIFELLQNENAKDSLESYEVSTLTNPYINLESVEQALQTLTYDEKLVRMLGQHKSLSGFIYSGESRVRPEVHIIPPFELDWEKYVVVRGLDPHPSKETCCVEAAIDRLGTVFVIGAYFENADSEQVKKDLAKRAVDKKYRLGWTCYDKSLDYEAKGYDSINIINRFKMPPNPVPAMFASEKYKGSIDAGIDTIKQYLKINPNTKKPKIYFWSTPEVKRVVRDMQTLERDSARNEDKRGKRDKILEGSKDFHACLRYIFQRPIQWIAPDDIEQTEDNVPERYI